VALADETGIPVGENGDDDTPVPLRTRMMGIIFAVLLLLVVGVVFLHVALKPVPAGKAAPERHYPGPCWICHTVTNSVEGTDGP
jgi:hypothetical protein